MRKFYIVTLLLLVCVCAGAQVQKQLDSMRFILPQFSQGVVLSSDKQISSGLLNICPLDQGVYIISPKKDTLYASNNSEIISVSVAGRSFIKWNNSFVELITSNSDPGIGIIRSVVKVSNVKSGAFGTTSSTSAISNYAPTGSSGMLTELVIIDDPRNYLYKRSVCIINNGKCLAISKKSFQKVFPDKKDYIASVWAERNLSSTDIDAVIAFYNDLLGK